MENNNFLLRGLHTMKKSFFYLFSALILMDIARASDQGFKLHEDIPEPDEFLNTYANQTVDGWKFGGNWGIPVASINLGANPIQIFWTLRNLNKNSTTHPVHKIKVMKHLQDARKTLTIEFNKEYVQSHQLELTQNLHPSSKFEEPDPLLQDLFEQKTLTLLSCSEQPIAQSSIQSEEHLLNFMVQQQWITQPLKEMLMNSLVIPIKFRGFRHYMDPNTRYHRHIMPDGNIKDTIVHESNGILHILKADLYPPPGPKNNN